MSTDAVIARLLRSWFVVAIGMTATAAFIAYLMAVQPLYYASSEITLSTPGTSPDQVIAFAQAVESVVNEGRRTVRFASPDAPLYGMGVREGSSVALPDSGGQWQTSYSRPVLSVEVVAESPERLMRIYADVVDQVEAAVASLQAGQQVGSDAMIVASIDKSPQVASAGPTRASKARAVVAASLVGVAATFTAAMLWERWRSRRRTSGELGALLRGSPTTSVQR